MRLNKLAKKIFAAGLAVSLMIAGSAASFADTVYTTEPAEITPSFDAYLVFDAESNVPKATFKYSVTKGAEQEPTAKTTAVYPGPDGLTISDIVFEGTETALSEVADGDTLTLDPGKKYAKKSQSIDISGLTFDEPGVYRYIITESTDSDAVSADPTPKVLDIFVEDVTTSDGAATLKATSFIMHEDPEATVDAETGKTVDADKKVKGFVNTYETFSLTINKKVSGNQASRNKEFTFSVAIANDKTSTKYTITKNNENPQIVDVTNDGYEDTTLKLKHGDTLVIKGLAKGATYVVSEDPEEYTSDKPENKVENKDGINADATETFLNTKNGTIPTGVILDSAPFILIIGLAAAALIFTAARKKVR